MPPVQHGPDGRFTGPAADGTKRRMIYWLVESFRLKPFLAGIALGLIVETCFKRGRR